MNYNKVWLIITVIFLLLMLLVNVFAPVYLKLYYPNVETVKITGGYIDGVYYGLIVPSSAIISIDNNGYIFQMVYKKSFWIEGTYSILSKVDVAATDSNSSAINAALRSGDTVIVKWNKQLEDGKRVIETR